MGRELDIDAQLDARDPALISSVAPLVHALHDVYFRASVRGLDAIPASGPVLFVGNHSGGNVTPDTWVFGSAMLRRFGVERALYFLAHRLVVEAPVVGPVMRRLGVVRAGHEVSEAIIERGESVMVYPGGDVEAHRPWTARHEIRFDERHGFVALARRTGVPLVPVVGCGGHGTYLPLTDGRALAERLRLDERLRLKVLPISLALPWGLNVGDLLGHIPAPVRITMQVLPPVDVDRFADDEAAYAHITNTMQQTLTHLAAERR